MPEATHTTEAQFENLHNMLRYAIDEHAIVAITDPSGVITFVNDRFCEISMYPREELLGQTHRIINSGHHPKSFFVELWSTITSGRTWRGEVCNRAKNGSLYWVDTTIVPYVNEHGKIHQYIAIRADITDRKATENELRQANENLEEFVYTASHDLKSPLLTIEGYAGHVQRYFDEDDRESAAHCIERISSAVRRMRENIDDLLELSRIGRVELDKQEIDLSQEIERILRDFETPIQESGVQIVVETGLPAIWCDPVRLKQLLTNMISNAIKYGCLSSGKNLVTIGAENLGQYVKLFVSDNGPGIEKQYREKVFDLFQCLESNTEGTGVGLNIVKRVAEIHGGRAWIEATPGGGATICVTLPVREIDLE